MERSIAALTTVGADPVAVGELLCRDPRAIIGTAAMLEATVRHVPVVRREVPVNVGDPTRTAGIVIVPLGWHASSLEDLFPTFEGELAAEPLLSGTRLRLTGTYTVPLGLLGRFGDGLLFRRIAQESLGGWLEDLARRLGHAVGAAPNATYHADVDERSGPAGRRLSAGQTSRGRRSTGS